MAETTVTVVASKRESLEPYIKILQRSNDIDVSFSSYLKPNNNKQQDNQEDGELSIFDARKYFSEIGNNDTSKPQTNNIENTTKLPSSKVSSFSVSHTVTASSEASWNSQTGLLPNRKNGRKKGSFSTPKWFFRRRTCPCSSSKSVQIQETKPRTVPDRIIHQTISSSDPVRLIIPSNNLTRSIDYSRAPSSFSFPTLYETSKSLDKPKKPVLNPVKPGNTEEEAASDASSDLFEIESFSTKKMTQPVRNSVDETGTEFGYAPSEASVTWSVNTAETAAFCDKRRFLSCRCEKEEEVAEKVLCNNGNSKLSIMKRHESNNGGSFV